MRLGNDAATGRQRLDDFRHHFDWVSSRVAGQKRTDVIRSFRSFVLGLPHLRRGRDHSAGGRDVAHVMDHRKDHHLDRAGTAHQSRQVGAERLGRLGRGRPVSGNKDALRNHGNLLCLKATHRDLPVRRR